MSAAKAKALGADDQRARLLDAVERHPATLLYLLDAPIVFHRAYVPLTGRVTAALLLSWAVELSDQAGKDGWIARTAEQWMSETGLSRDELSTAKRCLRELGVLHERRDREDNGLRVVMRYRVDFDRLSDLLADQAMRFAGQWQQAQ
ncbi:MAG TPA: hypothetical protein VFR86_17875 [Burkholderiaceae bacterium]|nr:hypothetical protein [Burkholderiaceae bacterium]